MSDIRQVLTTPQLRSRLPRALRAQLGIWLYSVGHTFLDVAVFDSGVVNWLDRAQLADRADRRWEFGESEEYRLVDPLPSPSTPESIRTASRDVRMRRPFVAELREATLFGPDAIVKTAEGEVILETTEHGDWTPTDGNCKRNLFNNLVHARLTSERESTPHDRVVCPIVDPWARGYFHWIVDALPKLQAVERYVAESGDVPQLVVPKSVPSWMKRSLELTGYDLDDCIRWEGRMRTFDRVVVPTLRREEDALSIDALRWLRNRMTTNANPVDRDWSDRVYISRRKAQNRQLINEPVLEERLAMHGFETYVLEDLSVDEQISLFSQAEVVFGLHGAGFTNSLFATDATVVELFGSTVHSTVYYHMASGLGFDYSAIQCPSVARDVFVDPDRVVEQLEQVLNCRGNNSI